MSIDYIQQQWKPILVQCCAWANLSPDPSTQNAAVLVGPGASDHDKGKIFTETFSVNEFPRGVPYLDERWERPQKYDWIEHAERNAIFSAARQGIMTQGLTMVCPWAACANCARAIIQAGIRRLVTITPRGGDTPERWDDSIKIAMQMLHESRVEVVFVDGPLDCGFTLRRDGVQFAP